MPKIYTRTGDSGTTSLVGGARVSKTHPRLEAYGTIDELSSHLGLIAAQLDDGVDRAFVIGVQQTLFDLCTLLATEPESAYQPAPLAPALIAELESEIDRMQAQLPPLRTFVVPGGSQLAAQTHICRTICRRAERYIIAMAEQHPVSPEVMEYINRLSDYLFVLARYLNVRSGVQEVTYCSRR